jgi:hypothetical protein
MRKLVQTFILTALFLFSFSKISLAQNETVDVIKARKLTYGDFINKYSINDTSAVIIDIFFDKKENAAYGQMSFLPITTAIYIISPPLSVGLTVISFPVFVNGVYTLVKFRKKKLLKVLLAYKETKSLPNWVRRKANRLLAYYESVKVDY